VVSTQSSREVRAFALVEERGHLIRTLGGDRYEVPSCTTEGRRYLVHYGGAHEGCSCPDRVKPCKHLLSVGIQHAARRSGVQVRSIGIAGDPFASAAKRRPCKVSRHPMIRPLSSEKRAQMRAGLDRLIARAEREGL
jgi:hypothetical protein